MELRSITIEDSQNLNLNISPNPASHQFSLLIDGMESDGEIQIFDMTGSLIYKQFVNQHTTKVNIDADTGQYHDGIYIVTLNTGTEVLTERVIISK